jgi:nucleoside diphosphate kinase
VVCQVGDIITRFEKKGFQLMGMKMVQADQALLEKHYAEHVERSFFPGLVKYMMSGPVVGMIWRGRGIVAATRKLIGKTNPAVADLGTIRGGRVDCCALGKRLKVFHGAGDLAQSKGRNLVHARCVEICFVQWLCVVLTLQLAVQ